MHLHPEISSHRSDLRSFGLQGAVGDGSSSGDDFRRVELVGIDRTPYKRVAR